MSFVLSIIVSLFFFFLFFFFFNDTATTEIYTLPLHDALPISAHRGRGPSAPPAPSRRTRPRSSARRRSEEHTSELQSLAYLVCRLLLEKKKKNKKEQRVVEKITQSHSG